MYFFAKDEKTLGLFVHRGLFWGGGSILKKVDIKPRQTACFEIPYFL